MNLSSMDRVGYKTQIATQEWFLSDWKAFRSSVSNYYMIRDRAYNSKDYGLINDFREHKLRLILKYKNKTP